jgi:choline dehydrogenase-like flavoprotein
MTQPARSFHDGLVTEHYDVIIVGSGAGGGTLAHTLAPSGKRILLLERGDFLPRETDNWDPNVNCKANELDNLYVVDTSFFPSIGAVNPALTAMANAIRVGEHLLGRMS